MENEGVRVEVLTVPGRGYSCEVTARPGTKELDYEGAGARRAEGAPRRRVLSGRRLLASPPPQRLVNVNAA